MESLDPQRAPLSVLTEYWVVQVQLGDSHAFTWLVRRWHPRLLRHAHHFTRDVEGAHDVAQESWLAVVRGIASLKDPARFRPWVLRIVANKARDWVRREQSRRRLSDRAAADLPVVATLDASDRSDPLQRVRAGLDALEPDQRLVLTWYYLEELSVGEIAQALCIPSGTVKSRLFHARNALRARLEER